MRPASSASGAGSGDERLLQHPCDVAVAIRLHVARLERVAQRLVTGVELDEVLVGLDRLVFEVRALVEDGGALQEEALLLLRAVGGRVNAVVGELLVVVDPGELRVDPLEGARVPGIRPERLLEVRGRTELVAQDLPEEECGAVVELRLVHREQRLQLAALRHGLVGEGELGDAVEAHRGVVQLLPDLGVEGALRLRREERVEDLLFVLELCLERRNGRRRVREAWREPRKGRLSVSKIRKAKGAISLGPPRSLTERCHLPNS